MSKFKAWLKKNITGILVGVALVVICISVFSCTQNTTVEASQDNVSGVYSILQGDSIYKDTTGTKEKSSYSEEDGYVIYIDGGPGVAKVGYCIGLLEPDGVMKCDSTMLTAG